MLKIILTICQLWICGTQFFSFLSRNDCRVYLSGQISQIDGFANIVAAKQLQAANERDKLKAKVTFQTVRKAMIWGKLCALNSWSEISTEPGYSPFRTMLY